MSCKEHETVQEMIELNRKLITSIEEGDWQAYTELCDEELTSFEPEARGQLVHGLPFHKFYFELGGGNRKHHTTMSSPHVQLLGEDVAVVSYIRLTQFQTDEQIPVTSRFSETRIWHRKDGRWRHVHFHRSASE